MGFPCVFMGFPWVFHIIPRLPQVTATAGFTWSCCATIPSPRASWDQKLLENHPLCSLDQWIWHRAAYLMGCKRESDQRWPTYHRDMPWVYTMGILHGIAMYSLYLTDFMSQFWKNDAPKMLSAVCVKKAWWPGKSKTCRSLNLFLWVCVGV